MTFDGSAIEGFSRVQESDMLALPDPNTFEILPWRGEDAPVARMFCDVQHLSGEPFEGDPRNVLQPQPRARREKGFTFYAAPEMEFFYFKSQDAPEPLDHAGYFDLTEMDMASNLRKQTILTLEAMGIPVEYSHHELGPSQHEIDLRYTDALDHGRQRHDVPGRRQGGRHRSRRVRDVHAEADRRRVRVGHAHATCRCSKATSTRSTTPATSTGSRRSGSASSPGCCATRARSPPSRTSRSTRTSG